MLLMIEISVNAVARKVDEHDIQLWRVFHSYLSNVNRSAINEISASKGHDYIKLFVDIDTEQVLFTTEGRDSSVLWIFKNFIEIKV